MLSNISCLPTAPCTRISGHVANLYFEQAKLGKIGALILGENFHTCIPHVHITSSHQLPAGVSAPGHRRVVNNSFQLIAYRQPREFSGIRGSCDRVLVQFSEILSNLWDRPPSGNSIGLVGCECLCLAAAREQRHLDCMSASNERRVDSRILSRVHLLACGRNGLRSPGKALPGRKLLAYQATIDIRRQCWALEGVTPGRCR